MNEIFNIIIKNISDENIIFVFPTEIAANLWLDKYITDVLVKNLPYPRAIGKERFLSWDKFKTSSIKSTRQDRDIIPSIVRKIFAIDLIEKNKLLIKNKDKPLFKELISQEYAEFSHSFASWITKSLPQLELWQKKYFSKKSREEASPIEEDYFTLYDEYKSFLDLNNLYDSAWETPPFADEGKTYFIFFPESLSDFEEYKELLSSSNHIELVTLDKLGFNFENCPSAKFFDNAAQEIHHLILFIKNAYENENIPYEKIAISLTDPEGFLPYLERELEKYNIPFNTRIGKSIGKYLSGRLFSSIQACYKNKFSFASIQNLVSNESLFWKYPNLNQGLINFGITKNCFCAFEEDGVFQYPFAKAFEEEDDENKVKKYYESLQKCITKLCESKSFNDILTNYWKFKTTFLEELNLDEKDTPPTDVQLETDAILGRAISELSDFLSLEKDKNFFGLKLPSCFDFFVDYITEKEYLAKPKNQGVNIYPYRVAAAAPFDLHIIPNATQKNLSVVFPRLSFMPKNLKEMFDITDTDISSVYVSMYLANSQKSTFYSASTFSYSGYSIIHSLLKEEKTENINPYGIYDVIKEENNFWLESDVKNLEKITDTQKSSFESWKKTSDKKILPTTEFNSVTQKLIKDYFINNNIIKISATSMNSFYQCPREMLLGKILKIFNEKEEAELSSLQTGTILHNVLDMYFSSYNKKEIKNFCELEKDFVSELLDNVVETYKTNFINRKILDSQKSEIKKTLINFLTNFTKKFEGYNVYATEYSLERKLEFSNSNEHSTFPMDINIIGKIDLILSKDENLYIVDYKTKKVPSISSCRIGKNQEDPSNFQLAFYTYLLEGEFENVEITEALFISIESSEETVVFSPNKGRPKVTREDFQKSMDRIMAMTLDFAKAILEENLGFPKSKIKKDCNKCNYRKYCRTLYSVSGRNKFSGDER